MVFRVAVSHKMLRWLTGGFAATAAAGVLGMIVEAAGTVQVASVAGVLRAESWSRPTGSPRSRVTSR
jgi:hypothetical protein